MKEDKLLKNLKDSLMHEKIIKVKKIYDKLERKQKSFCNVFDIHCASGCGKCCEHFTPDISEVEALFLAYGLIKENKDDLVLELIKNKNKNDKYCPLYIKDSNYHCSVYKWRPLVCRLFGASASKDKNGSPCFRKCKWNNLGHDIDKSAFSKHEKNIITMIDFAEELNCIDSDDNSTKLIYEILPDAIDKIRYYLSLTKKENK